MNFWYKAAGATLTATLIAAGSAAAQERASTCDITANSPNEMRNAMGQLARYQLGTGNAQQRREFLRSAVRATTERPDRFRNNEVGRQYALGQALAYFAIDPETPLVAPRGELGFLENPEAPIDLTQAVHEALSFVENERPGCRQELAGFRAQVWQRMLQQGVDVANAGQPDSGIVLIRKANTIFDDLPHGHYYLAAVLQEAGRTEEAVASFRRTLEQVTAEAALEDTTLIDIRENSLFIVALAEYEAAEGLTGEAQREHLRSAAELFRQHGEEFPESQRAGSARMMMMNAYAQMGDTASLNRTRREMLAAADQYNADQLLEVGTHAFTQKDTELAIQLLERGVEKNPYSRPGLFNLTNAYWDAKRFDRMLETARRLVALDPNNASNVELLAIAMEGNARTMQNAQARRAQQDSVRALVNRARDMPIHVTFSPMSVAGDQRAVNGEIRNQSAQQRQVNVQFEFLDASGQVVGRESAQVTVPARGTQNFSVRVTAPTAVGFRYAPIG